MFGQRRRNHGAQRTAQADEAELWHIVALDRAELQRLECFRSASWKVTPSSKVVKSSRTVVQMLNWETRFGPSSSKISRVGQQTDNFRISWTMVTFGQDLPSLAKSVQDLSKFDQCWTQIGGIDQCWPLGRHWQQFEQKRGLPKSDNLEQLLNNF